MFVPRILIGKPIRIFANEQELSAVTANKEEKIETSLVIPSDLIKTNELKIKFKSPMWIPKEIDPKVRDSRTLSVAMDYLELREI